MEQHQATGKLNELAMGKVFLYCDESGAKGYADKDEAKPGEVGGLHEFAAITNRCFHFQVQLALLM